MSEENVRDLIEANRRMTAAKAPEERKALLQKDNAAVNDAALKVLTSGASFFAAPGRKSVLARSGAFLMATFGLLGASMKALGDNYEIQPPVKHDKSGNPVADNDVHKGKKEKGAGIKTGTAGAFDKAHNPASPSMTAVNTEGRPVGATKTPEAPAGTTPPAGPSMDAAA